MKKLNVLLFVALCAIGVSCSKSQPTTLTDTNAQYTTWEDAKLFATLTSNEQKGAICTFNENFEVIDSSANGFADCSNNTKYYKAKDGFVLKYDDMKCVSFGNSLDLVYYNAKGDPVIRYILRFLPSTGRSTETVLFFGEQGVYKDAQSRSAIGVDRSYLKDVDFISYEPMIAEKLVDKYQAL